jgi:CMP-N-acetylneuraminic acid synthetase
MVTRSMVAIIPARGGSKRIEKKNIIDFCGKPMIAWSIEAATKAGIFERVVVSTDDQNIAVVAQQFGASVPFLRRDYADDVSPVSLATIGTLSQLREELGAEYDVAVQLQPNCPLRNERHIVEAVEHFEKQRPTSQISCFRFGWMNPWWAAALSESGRPRRLFPEVAETRSQDLPPLYCPTGAICIAEVARLMEHRTYHMPDCIFWPMAWKDAVDIDDDDDLRMAELLYLMKGRRQRREES